MKPNMFPNLPYFKGGKFKITSDGNLFNSQLVIVSMQCQWH